MNPQNFFDTHDILLLDGATGSHLIAKGLPTGECPELWNISHKKQVQEIAVMYFTAGSDAVLTNTFGGSFLKLSSYGLQNRTHELNYAGARNAIEVKPSGRFVFGSIGPCGKILLPYGEVSEDEVTDSFRLQAKSLADAGVDGFMLETFLDIRELLCAVNAVKQVCELPFLASLTYQLTPRGFFTMMGTGIEEEVAILIETGAFAIGSNCGNGIANMVQVGQQLRLASGAMKLLLKPNAGEPVLKDGVTCYTEDASDFKNHFAELAALKPLILGGCCGTDAAHISVLRKLIDGLNKEM